MKTKLPETIKTVEDAKLFLTELHKNGESYHPEDNAKDCLEDITNEEGDKLNELMNQIYLLPGNENYQSMVFDPCGFILKMDAEFNNSILQDEMKDFPKNIEVTIETSNNPHGNYEMSVVANDEILARYWYDSKEDAQQDAYKLEDFFEVTFN